MKLRRRALKVLLAASLLTGAAVGPVTTSPADAAPTPRTVHGCRPGQFCTYANRNYTDMVDRMSSCVLHRSHGVFRSYVNNQTGGARARFYDSTRELLLKTSRAPGQAATSLGGNGPDGAFFIRPC